MAEIRPAEISEILRNEIRGFEGSVTVRETGRVLSCGDGIAVVVVYDAIVSLILLKLVDFTIGLRVDTEMEREGLDLAIHGEAVQ